MSRKQQTSRGLSASMAMLAAMMGAVAPVAAVSPQATGAQAIQAPSGQQQQQSMGQQQTVRTVSNLGALDGGFHGWRAPSVTSIHTFPKWSQRKARKAFRQTGRKIQKRYAR